VAGQLPFESEELFERWIAVERLEIEICVEGSMAEQR